MVYLYGIEMKKKKIESISLEKTEHPSHDRIKRPEEYHKQRTKWAQSHGLFNMNYRNFIIDKSAYNKSKGFIEDKIDEMLDYQRRDYYER